MLGSLGDPDGQDALVEAGGDCILLDVAGEVECAAELANAALAAPELGAVCRLLLLLDGLRSLLLDCVAGSGRCLGRSVLVLDSGLVLVDLLKGVLSGCGDAALRGGRGGGSVGALDAAVDAEGLRIGELNIHVLLLQASEFSVQLKVCGELADVKLGLEGNGGPGSATGRALILTGVGVKVFEKTEERGEAGVGVAVVAVAREEGHFDGCGGCWVDDEGVQFVGGRSDVEGVEGLISSACLLLCVLMRKRIVADGHLLPWIYTYIKGRIEDSRARRKATTC